MRKSGIVLGLAGLFTIAGATPQLMYSGLGKNVATNISNNGGANFEDVYAGEINVERCDINQSPFYTYCADILDHMDESGNCWNVDLLDTTSLSQNALEIGYLVNKYAPVIHAVGTDDDARLFQCAIWELLYETSGTYDLTTGNFVALDGSGNPLTASELVEANSFLADAGAGVAHYFQLGPHSQGDQQSQDLVSPVPEPAPVAALGIGLAGLFRRKLRR